MENRIPRLARPARNVAVPEDWDEDRRFSQSLFGQFQGEVDIVGSRSPRFRPEAPARDLLEDAEDREVEKNTELLRRRGSPVRKSSGDREAFAENGAKVGREGEVEEGLDGGEFDVGEAVGDGDVGGSEVRDEALGVGGEGEADELLRLRLSAHLRDVVVVVV